MLKIVIIIRRGFGVLYVAFGCRCDRLFLGFRSPHPELSGSPDLQLNWTSVYSLELEGGEIVRQKQGLSGLSALSKSTNPVGIVN